MPKDKLKQQLDHLNDGKYKELIDSVADDMFDTYVDELVEFAADNKDFLIKVIPLEMWEKFFLSNKIMRDKTIRELIRLEEKQAG